MRLESSVPIKVEMTIPVKVVVLGKRTVTVELNGMLHELREGDTLNIDFSGSIR